jgi:predicted nuclease with TOPRIM domain
VHAQKTDAKLDQIQHTLVAHDLRFDRLEQRFDGLDKRVDGLEKRFDGLEAKFDRQTSEIIETLNKNQLAFVGALNLALDRFRRDDTQHRLDRLEDAVFGAKG